MIRLVHVPGKGHLPLHLVLQLLAWHPSSSSSTSGEGGHPCHQVLFIKVPPWAQPNIIIRFVFFAMPWLAGGPRLPSFFSRLQRCPSVGYLVERILARWQQRRGKLWQLPKTEVVLTASLVIWQCLFSAVVQHSAIFMLPLEVVDPGGSPLTLLLPHLLARCQSESVLAGGHSNSGKQLWQYDGGTYLSA